MNNIMAITNGYYLRNGAGIQFYFCGTLPDYIDNDNLYNSFTAFSKSGVDGRDAPNALNQYYVNASSQSGLGGYAYFPNENRLGATRSFILNEADETDLANPRPTPLRPIYRSTWPSAGERRYWINP